MSTNENTINKALKIYAEHLEDYIKDLLTQIAYLKEEINKLRK